MSGEERLIELFRSLDNRGKRHLLVIAEAEAKHVREGLQKADNWVLVANSQDYASEGETAK